MSVDGVINLNKALNFTKEIHKYNSSNQILTVAIENYLQCSSEDMPVEQNQFH